ncbi:hypothetical protein, partial [Tenacibaculum singaporense]
RNAEKSLGHIKGAFQTLERQQTQGIKEANAVIKANQQKLNAIKQSIVQVKQKIAKYKAERDHEKAQAANATPAEVSNANKKRIAGIAKENAPLILGGIALLGAVVYLNKKSPTHKTVKSVSV